MIEGMVGTIVGTMVGIGLGAKQGDVNMSADTVSLRSVTGNSEVQAYANRLETMINQARKNVLDAEVSYATRRAELVHALDDLEAEARRRIPELQAMVMRLVAMRDG
jgi:hypothetical protein